MDEKKSQSLLILRRENIAGTLTILQHSKSLGRNVAA